MLVVNFKFYYCQKKPKSNFNKISKFDMVKF